MAKGNSSKGAVPAGLKAGTSFGKRSATTQKTDAGRKPNADFGPTKVGNIGGSVSDDNAGTRSRANLPPQTTAIKGPEATVPAAVKSLAAGVLPVPSADTPLFTVEPFDYARDRKLGRQGS